MSYLPREIRAFGPGFPEQAIELQGILHIIIIIILAKFDISKRSEGLAQYPSILRLL